MQRIPIHRKLLCVTFLGAELLVCSRYCRVGIEQTLIRLRGADKTETIHASGPNPTEPSVFGFPMPSLSRFQDGSFQDNWEKSAQRSFLVPEQTLVGHSRILSTRLSRLALSIVPKSHILGIPLWKEYLLVEPDLYLGKAPKVYRTADMNRIGACATFYNQLKHKHPSVHFYVAPILSADDWFFMTHGGPTHILAGNRYVKAFRDLLNPSIGYEWIAEGCTREEALQGYYQTDHHLNSHGAHQAYCQILDLIRTQSPQVSRCLQPRDWKTGSDLAFYGTKSRFAGYYDGLHDPFICSVFDLPELDIHIHGYGDVKRNHKAAYATDTGTVTPLRKFANHYSHCFGRDYGLITYTCKQVGTGRLLVVSDSSDNCIEDLLAAHFLQTFFVDLRHYPADVGHPFDVDEFIADHAITDILFLGEQGAVIGFGEEHFFCDGT